MAAPLISRRLAGAIAALSVTSCALPVPQRAPESSAPPVEALPCTASRGQLVLDVINDIRQEHGLRLLSAESHLVAAALSHTEDLAARGPDAIGHIGFDGSAPGDRVTAAGYDWVLVAENVAAGIPSASGVVAGWMNSPPHRATILSPEAVHAGIGYVHRYAGALNHFWTLNVAAPRDARAADRLACHP